MRQQSFEHPRTTWQPPWYNNMESLYSRYAGKTTNATAGLSTRSSIASRRSPWTMGRTWPVNCIKTAARTSIPHRSHLPGDRRLGIGKVDSLSASSRITTSGTGRPSFLRSGSLSRSNPAAYFRKSGWSSESLDESAGSAAADIPNHNHKHRQPASASGSPRPFTRSRIPCTTA